MSVRIRLEPLGMTLTAPAGAPLADLLFPHGVEFPCGGRGTCRGCRVRLSGAAGEPTREERDLLSATELAAGWRLACRTRATGDLIIDIAQWTVPVLSDDRALACRPRPGLGLAVDVGTTTLVAQLVDLATARVLAVRTALNPQAAFGSDIMTRVEAALAPEGARSLRDAVRQEIARMLLELCAGGQEQPVVAVLVGNTVMHHLFCGIDVHPLAEAPFETPRGGVCRLSAHELGWPMADGADIRFLGSLGGFVGSDVLAGIRATRLGETSALEVLVDLGTNAEIAVGTHDRLLCASTAAGPAFEGGRISCGMRAATGAIAAVTVVDGHIVCDVLGGGRPRGLCGSGLVDAIRCGLDLGRIEPSGRLAGGARTLPISEDVTVAQSDVREVQLAKAAIAAGLDTLLATLGASRADVARVHLAGAFGNYVSRDSARRIGLLDFEPVRVCPAGNAALLGAKLALFDEDDGAADALAARVQHVRLGDDEAFREAYVRGMRFPGKGD